MQREREQRPFSAMKEMKSGEYSPEIDELEKKRDRHGEPKRPCKGNCGRSYTLTTLRKYSGMCCRCRDAQQNKRGHYTAKNALNKGYYKASAWKTRNRESDSDNDEKKETDDSENDSDFTDSDTDSSSDDEKEQVRAHARPFRQREFKEHTASEAEREYEEAHPPEIDDDNFVVDEDVVEMEYERPGKSADETELEAEVRDLQFENALPSKYWNRTTKKKPTKPKPKPAPPPPKTNKPKRRSKRIRSDDDDDKQEGEEDSSGMDEKHNNHKPCHSKPSVIYVDDDGKTHAVPCKRPRLTLPERASKHTEQLSREYTLDALSEVADEIQPPLVAVAAPVAIVAVVPPPAKIAHIDSLRSLRHLYADADADEPEPPLVRLKDRLLALRDIRAQIQTELDREVPTSHECRVCGKATDLKCTKCQWARYCSAECQKLDWVRQHRRRCSHEAELRMLF